MEVEQLAMLVSLTRDYEREVEETTMVFNNLIAEINAAYFENSIQAIYPGWNNGEIKWQDYLGTDHVERLSARTRRGEEIKRVFDLAQKREFLIREVRRLRRYLEDHGINHI